MCFGDMRWQSVTLQREMNAAHIVSGKIGTIPYSCTVPVESRLTATSLASGNFRNRSTCAELSGQSSSTAAGLNFSSACTAADEPHAT